MSGSENGDEQSGAGRREVAYRLFAAEYDDASLEHSESDEERAPNYVVTPTGARVNRLFVVGVLTEVEQVNEEVLRARIVDPTGAFVVYAGQYQPDEMAFLERTDPPAFLAVTGKARTFQPDDSDRVYTSIRPESINRVDAETRDRWIVQTAEQTLGRVATMASAIERPERGEELADVLRSQGVDAGLASGVSLALDHYGTTPAYLAAVRDLSVEAAEVVAGERDEASSLSVRPDEGDGSVDAGELADLVETLPDAGAAAAASDPGAIAETEPASAAETATSDDSAAAAGTATAEAETETGASDAGETDAGSATAGEADAEPAAADEEADAEPAAVTTGSAASTEPVGEDAAPESSSADTPDSTDTAVEPESAADESGGDRIGDFEPGGLGEESAEEPESEDAADQGSADLAAPEENGDDAEAAAADTPVGGDEMYEFSEEEREQIEEEYGTEFSTGTEVPEPGEADIETPDPDEADVETPDPTGEVGGDAGGEAGVPEETAAASEAEEVVEEAKEPVPGAADADAPEDAGDVETPDVETEAGAGAEADVEDGEESDAGIEPDSESEAEADADAADAEAAEDEATGEDEVDIPDDVSLTDVVIERMRELDDGDGVDRGDLIDDVVADTGMTETDVEDAIEEALMGGRCYEPTDDTLKPI